MDGAVKSTPVAAPVASSYVERSKSWTGGRTRAGPGASALTEASTPRRKIRLGVCAMDKKARGRPMTALLKRLEGMGDFECVIFGNDCILHQPVEEVRFSFVWVPPLARAVTRPTQLPVRAQWPLCDCLISFFSGGFPLEKAQSYVALRRPFMVNDLDMEHKLRDRREVYRMLWKAGVPQARCVHALNFSLRSFVSPF